MPSRHVSPSRYLLAVMLCGLASQWAGPAAAEKLAYGTQTGYAPQITIQTDGAASSTPSTPDLQALKKHPLSASKVDLTLAPIHPDRVPAPPLKVVIPNLHAAKQAEPPQHAAQTLFGYNVPGWLSPSSIGTLLSDMGPSVAEFPSQRLPGPPVPEPKPHVLASGLSTQSATEMANAAPAGDGTSPFPWARQTMPRDAARIASALPSLSFLSSTPYVADPAPKEVARAAEPAPMPALVTQRAAMPQEAMSKPAAKARPDTKSAITTANARPDRSSPVALYPEPDDASALSRPSTEKTAATSRLPWHDVSAATADQASAEKKAAAPEAKLFSSGIVIHKEVLHMETPQPQTAQASPYQLAQLAPAAGADTPLIQLPVMPAPAQPSQSQTAPKPAPAGPHAPLNIKPLLVSPPATPAAPAAVSALPNANSVDEVLKAVLGDSLYSSTVSSNTSETNSKEAAEAEKKKAEARERRKKIAKMKPKQQEKLVFNHIPKTMGKKKELGKPFDIDHAKEIKDVFNPDGSLPESATHAAKGIKIEIKRPPLDVHYELQHAYDALTSGHSAAAMEIYKNILTEDPGNTSALFGLATLYHRAGQLNKARPLYAELLSIDPDNRDGLNNFLVLLGDENPSEALVELSKLEKSNPGFSPIPAQMAIIYEKNGDLEKATEKMDHAIELAPENLTYRYDMAIMLDKQHKYAEAAALYRQLIVAYQHGAEIPGNLTKIQQRLTFISSNRP